MKSKEEMFEVIDKALEAQNNGSKWPGMSYEDGVEASLRWAMGECEQDPMEE